MIARFSDNTALTSAYGELLELGIAQSCITPCFEETGSETKDPEVHRSFLEQLHQWHSSSFAGTASGSADTHTIPTSPAFRNHGGVLKIRCGNLDVQCLDVVLRHDAVLVG